MGKHEPFSPKAIANRIKFKGLQKLRWYCQMCQKQCRDENGFKCHITSESHQRQLLLFGESSAKFLGGFSQEFEKGFMDILRRRYGTRRVKANDVYQEYIKDKDHIHMNSTHWHSLTGFCLYLGKTGKCIVDETEKGWFIKYVERDPEEVRRQESLRKREKQELDDEERLQKNIEEQIRNDKSSVHETEFTELQRDSDEKVAFTLIPKTVKKEEEDADFPAEPSTSAPSSSQHKAPSKLNALQTASLLHQASRGVSLAKSTSSTNDKKRKTAREEILEEEMRRKEQKKSFPPPSKPAKRDYWLHKDIVVKINTPRLGDEFYKKKGIVKEVQDKYTAVVEMIDSAKRIKVDQVHVETVLPALGKAVLIVNGPHVGEEAALLDITESDFCARIKLTTGPNRGETVERIDYEDICKIQKE